jgi:hypothetical protein
LNYLHGMIDQSIPKLAAVWHYCNWYKTPLCAGSTTESAVICHSFHHSLHHSKDILCVKWGCVLYPLQFAFYQKMAHFKEQHTCNCNCNLLSFNNPYRYHNRLDKEILLLRRKYCYRNQQNVNSCFKRESNRQNSTLDCSKVEWHQRIQDVHPWANQTKMWYE